VERAVAPLGVEHVAAPALAGDADVELDVSERAEPEGERAFDPLVVVGADVVVGFTGRTLRCWVAAGPDARTQGLPCGGRGRSVKLAV
jgi:hypothetical protein